MSLFHFIFLSWFLIIKRPVSIVNYSKTCLKLNKRPIILPLIIEMLQLSRSFQGSDCINLPKIKWIKYT